MLMAITVTMLAATAATMQTLELVLVAPQPATPMPTPMPPLAAQLLVQTHRLSHHHGLEAPALPPLRLLHHQL